MTDKEPSPLSKELNDDLKKEGIEQANILEIGAGNGRDSIFLAKQGHTTTGIDVAEQAITAAKKNAGKLKNVTFEKGDVKKLKYPDESFDAVFSVAALHSTPLDDSLAEIHRVLKPGGIAKIHQYTKIVTAGKTIHYWKPEQIKRLVEEAGFSVLESHTTTKTDMVEVEGVKEKIKQDNDIIVYTIKKEGLAPTAEVAAPTVEANAASKLAKKAQADFQQRLEELRLKYGFDSTIDVVSIMTGKAGVLDSKLKALATKRDAASEKSRKANALLYVAKSKDLASQYKDMSAQEIFNNLQAAVKNQDSKAHEHWSMVISGTLAETKDLAAFEKTKKQFELENLQSRDLGTFLSDITKQDVETPATTHRKIVEEAVKEGKDVPKYNLVEYGLTKQEVVDTRLPATILADRVLESIKIHESKIKPEQKQERARRAKLIEAEVERLTDEGVSIWEAFPQAFKTHGKGSLTDYDLFEPLWGKVDAKALFEQLKDLDKGVYDKYTVIRALTKVFNGIVNTEGEAKALGDIYGFEVRSALDQRIASNKALRAVEKLREGKPLTLNEASLIGRFYPDLAKLAWKAVPKYDKILPYLKQIWFFRRTLVLGSDISLWMRQAKKDVTRHPITGVKAIAKSFKAYGIPVLKANTKKAEAYTQRSIKDTQDLPYYNEAKAAGINVYELPPMGVPLVDIEGLEWYKGGELAERVPFFGNFVRAGQRAWIAGSNYFHMVKYAHDRKRFEDADGNITEKQSKALVGQINSELGRTKLPKSGFTTTAQTLMLAPGFVASRVVTPMHPFRFLFQWNKDAVRLSRLSAESWATFIGSGLLTLAGLKWIFGDEAEIDDDPASSGFGKIKTKDTHWDIWAGYGQAVRFSIQLALAAQDKQRTTTSGRKRDVDVKNLVTKLGRSKSSLLVGGAVDWYTEQNYVGEPFPPEEFLGKVGLGLESFTPMWIRDMVEATIEDGVLIGLPAGAASFLGEGVSSYKERASIQLQRYEDEVAIKQFEKRYEELSPRQQDMLYERHPDLKLLKLQAGVEKESPAQLNKMLRDQYKSGRIILKSLPQDIQKGLESATIRSIGLDRSWRRKNKIFYLNDKRYEWYQKRVTELLNLPGNIKRLRIITEKAIPLRKEQFYNDRINKIKSRARDELNKLMSRRKI